MNHLVVEQGWFESTNKVFLSFQKRSSQSQEMSQPKEFSSTSKSTETPGSAEKRPPEQLERSDSKRARSEVRVQSTRQYLDNAVVPILLDGLAALSRERPEDPIDYLISYLQKHKKEYSQWFLSFMSLYQTFQQLSNATILLNLRTFFQLFARFWD